MLREIALLAFSFEWGYTILAVSGFMKNKLAIIIILSITCLTGSFALVIKVTKPSLLTRLYNSFAGTELFHAIANGDANEVKLLLEQKVDPNSKDFDGKPAIVRAAVTGRPDIVKLLAQFGADVNATYGPDKRNALGEAAHRGLTSVVRVLVENGANVDKGSRGFGGGTNLMAVAGLGYAQITKILIESGAHVNKRDEFGKTALAYAVSSYRDQDILKSLFQEAIEYEDIYHDERPKTIDDIKNNLETIIKLLQDARAVE
jgi:ankyrin repeat protein